MSKKEKQEACQLYIEQEIDAGLEEGKTPYSIGKEIAGWIEKLFEVKVKPTTIEKRAERIRNINFPTNVGNLTVDLSKEDEQAVLKTARQIKTERRQTRTRQREEQKAETIKTDPPLEHGNYELVQSDFREHKTEPNSIDAIITDPPYGIEYIPLYKDLSLFASNVLKQNAPCVVMIGQSWLEKALNYLSENLTYVWTIAYFSPGKSTQIFSRKVKSNWKPVIFLVNGNNECEHISDFVNSGHYDKDHHDWGQTVEGMAQLIDRFTIKGDLVMDPFCGAGTTGIASLKSGRRFIGIDNDEYAIKQSATRLQEIESGRSL